MPVDGLTSATRAPGEHRAPSSASTRRRRDARPPGDYQLVVEAAREVGGREIVRMPFQWPPQGAQVVKAPRQHELGAVALDLKP